MGSSLPSSGGGRLQGMSPPLKPSARGFQGSTESPGSVCGLADTDRCPKRLQRETEAAHGGNMGFGWEGNILVLAAFPGL